MKKKIKYVMMDIWSYLHIFLKTICSSLYISLDLLHIIW